METETNQLPEPPPSDYVIVVGYPRNPISGQFLKGPIDPKIVKKWGYGFTTDLEQAWPFSSENQAKAKAAIVDRHMAWGDGVLMVEPNVKAHTSLTEGELRSEQDSAPTQPPETTVGQGLCDATCSASSFCESNDVPKINANPVANRVGSLAPLIAFILCFSCTRSWANVFTAVSFEDFQGSEKLFSFPKSDVFLSDDNRSAMNFGNGCFVVSVAKSSGLCLHPVEEHQDKLAIGSAAASRIAAKSESVSICSSEVSCNHCNDPCCDSPWRLFGPVHIVFMGIAYMLGWYVDYLRSKSSYVILPNKQL